MIYNFEIISENFNVARTITFLIIHLKLLLILLYRLTEQAGVAVTLDLYSRGAQFKSWMGHQLS
jgi:hypothetical protein